MNRFEALFKQIVGNSRFDLDLGEKVHHVFGTAIELRVPLLTAESLDFGHGKAIDAEFSQRFANFIQFKGLDDCGNEFHETSYPS